MNFLPSLLKHNNHGMRFFVNKILPALVFGMLFTACDRETEAIPAYLHIDSFELLPTDPSKHGSVSQKITHVQLFMFDSTENKSISLGNFELPATIPVLNQGDFSLNVDPVIKANGNSFYLQAYPFYKRYSNPIQLTPNADVTVNPTTTYRDEAVFEFIEDFEHNGVLFSQDRDLDDSTSLEISDQGVFEGDYSGLVTLNPEHPVIVAQTTELYTIDKATSGKVFMELNYKTDVPLEFGLVQVQDDGTEGDINFEFVVVAKQDWNKIYFDMTDLVQTNPTSRFAIIFRGGIPLENGKYTLDKAEIRFDNIKLVHF